MTMSLTGLLILLVIAAVCGAIGKAIAGSVRGGLIVSIALGFVGALLGPWVARLLKLPEPFMITVDRHPFLSSPDGGGDRAAGRCPLHRQDHSLAGIGHEPDTRPIIVGATWTLL